MAAAPNRDFSFSLFPTRTDSPQWHFKVVPSEVTYIECLPPMSVSPISLSTVIHFPIPSK